MFIANSENYTNFEINKACAQTAWLKTIKDSQFILPGCFSLIHFTSETTFSGRGTFSGGKCKDSNKLFE